MHADTLYTIIDHTEASAPGSPFCDQASIATSLEGAVRMVCEHENIETIHVTEKRADGSLHCSDASEDVARKWWQTNELACRHGFTNIPDFVRLHCSEADECASDLDYREHGEDHSPYEAA